jgi:hypothetical protein
VVHRVAMSCGQPLRHTDMAGSEVWCRVTITSPLGVQRVTWLIRGDGAPDLDIVDQLAWLLLAARRLGDGLRLSEVCPRLGELLELVGLPVTT